MTAPHARPGAVAVLRTVLVAVLVAVVAAGCGEDDPYAAYCEVVEDNQQQLSEVLGPGGPSALLKALPIFRELQDAAPDDIRDEWQTVVGGLTALEDALDDAGVDPATYDYDDPPQDLDDEAKARIDAAAQKLREPAAVEASTAVEQQARDVCHTPLHL